MIDIHLHILPGVDDGPETIEEALALAQALVQDGIHTAIATPHYNDEFPRRPAAEIHERVYDLQTMLNRHAIPLRLLAGHEVLIKPGLVEDVQNGQLATLNGSRYLLLELWNSTWLPETERVIFELRAAGIVPIIAHVERYLTIQHDSERLVNLLRQGALAQVTASSLLGNSGRAARRCAEALLKKGLVHCIASDAHGLQTRPPCVEKGIHYAAHLLGQARVHQLIETVPAIVINNLLYAAKVQVASL